MGRVARIVVLVVAVVSAGLVAQPAWAAPPLPSSMAAIGDSITRAYDVCCSFVADELADVGPVFLLDMRVVVFLVRPAARELDGPRATVAIQVVVDEL